jgi:hypothetical protein
MQFDWLADIKPSRLRNIEFFSLNYILIRDRELMSKVDDSIGKIKFSTLVQYKYIPKIECAFSKQLFII